jgi:DNA invertase Pin-like site-specific DNA recombinase
VASAKNINNQVGLKKILKEDAQVLVIYNVSRFSRNVVQGRNMFENLRSKGRTYLTSNNVERGYS